MIALKYGALPLVRRTGGLADTVIDVEETARNGYGFVFDDPDPEAFLATLDRALGVYARPRQWTQLVRRGMRQDFGWLPSARQYQELYQQLAAGSAAVVQKEDGH
jgi:glycogen synthase